MAREIPILHADERLVVVHKPPGLLSVPDRSRAEADLVSALRAQGIDALAVHRLDREVSGAIVLALDEECRAALERAFRERALTKVYWAMAQGRLQAREGVWSWPIAEEGPAARVSARGAPSETRWRVLALHSAAVELELELVTGRRNQIRVHAAHSGHPLVGERKYARGRDQRLRFRSRRVALHAWRLGFAHPFGGRRIEVEAPLPDDLLRLREQAAALR